MANRDETNNLCADLVSLKEFEPFVTSLLRKERAKWFSVADLAAAAGLAQSESAAIGPELFVTWLEEPTGAEDYAVIIFYDQESKWTMAADYNRSRIFCRH